MVIFPNNGKFERVILSKGESYSLSSAGKEIVLVLIGGKIRIDDLILSRQSVFKDSGKGLCVANSAPLEIEALKDSSMCIVETNSSARVEMAHLQTPSCMSAGTFNTAREVCRLADNLSGLENLIVGETISPPGNWSSWPPHKHDTHSPNEESAQEEVYFYKFSNLQGFGIQMLEDRAFIVRENEEIKIEKGHHPVVSSPYSQMYYLWALYGDNSFFKAIYEGEIK